MRPDCCLYLQVISIAAVDWERKVASFSTFNGDVELAAPGRVCLERRRGGGGRFAGQLATCSL